MSSIYGVQHNADLDPAIFHRDTRPFLIRLSSALSSHGGILVVILALMAIANPFIVALPLASDFIFTFGIILYLVVSRLNSKYLLSDPLRTNKDGEFVNFKNKITDEDDLGIFCLGQDGITGSSLWLSNPDARAHALVFGATGSGKSMFLLGIVYQALVLGAGLCMVDGKADNSIFWMVYSLVRRFGREDDFLLINYLINEGNLETGARLTNTTNPFAHGTDEQLRSLIVGLMRESGGDSAMWKGRSSSMLGALMTVLCCLRDRGELLLSIGAIREHITLPKLIQLTQRTDLPLAEVKPIRDYLEELPGYKAEDAITGTLASEAYKQHGFLVMQLTEVMSTLSQTYKDIFMVPLGEVDFRDVIFQRRILFVMLPALQSDPDKLEGLGKMIVSAIKGALSFALGSEVEGLKAEVIDRKPTFDRVPFLLLLDEYGYYSVKGFAVVAAQARSLGLSVFFAGQDFPSFKRGGEEEAWSTVANTNLKICLKLEDPKETYEIMRDRAGEGHVTVTYGHEKAKGVLSTGASFNDKGETRLEKQFRINIRDLTKQAKGEAHIIFGDVLSRAKWFYVKPIMVPEARLNKFLMVEGATIDNIAKRKLASEKLDALFSGKDPCEIAESPRKARFKRTQGSIDVDKTDILLKEFIGAFNKSRNHAIPVGDSIKYAVSYIKHNQELSDAKMSKEATTSSGTKVGDSIASEINNLDGVDSSVATRGGSSDESNDNSLSSMAKKYESVFIEALNKGVIASIESKKGYPLSLKEQKEYLPESQLMSREAKYGADKATAEKNAEKAIDILTKNIIYPGQPYPNKRDPKELTSAIDLLMNDLKSINGE